MILKTRRLLLREWNSKDKKEIIEGLNNINVTKWMLVFPNPYTEKDADKFLIRMKEASKEKQRNSYGFAIELTKEKKVIGGINLRVDLPQSKAMTSYWLNENYWKQGYGSEAFEKILDFAFKKLKLRRIEASVYPGNPSSGKLLKKFGFKKEGYARKSHFCFADKKIKDAIQYGLLKEEYNTPLSKNL